MDGEEAIDWGGALVYGKVMRPVGQDVFDIPVRVQRDVADEAGNKLHPTPKPIELFETLLKKFTLRESLVIDPFLGSGTTLAACERLGRRCRGIEINADYVAVAIERWAVMTGKEPELVGGAEAGMDGGDG